MKYKVDLCLFFWITEQVDIKMLYTQVKTNTLSCPGCWIVIIIAVVACNLSFLTSQTVWPCPWRASVLTVSSPHLRRTMGSIASAAALCAPQRAALYPSPESSAWCPWRLPTTYACMVLPSRLHLWSLTARWKASGKSAWTLKVWIWVLTYLIFLLVYSGNFFIYTLSTNILF